MTTALVIVGLLMMTSAGVLLGMRIQKPKVMSIERAKELLLWCEQVLDHLSGDPLLPSYVPTERGDLCICCLSNEIHDFLHGGEGEEAD